MWGAKMARKTQITKEIILQAALNMLIRDGYSSINIKTLSKEIGCSTQPLVWHFGNMEGLRKALAEYALTYAKNKMNQTGDNAVGMFANIGKGYVDIAVNEPNLFRFLFLDENNRGGEKKLGEIITSKHNAEIIKNISKQLDMPEENVGRYLQNTIIYAYGIAALAATKLITASEEEIMIMINRVADAFIVQEGLPSDKIPQ